MKKVAPILVILLVCCNLVSATLILHDDELLISLAYGLGAMIIGFGLKRSFRIVQQGETEVVERLGKFHRQLNPGLHLTLPFVDRIRSTLTQREQVLDIPPQKCITADNAPLAADAVVYWRILDPEKAVYSVVDLEMAIQNLVLTELRAQIGKLTLDMTFSAREQVNAVLLNNLDAVTAVWGVKITRVEVLDIIPDSQILQAMELQMAAERNKRATIIKSEGERMRAINAAEGESQALLIETKAKAEASQMRAQAEAAKTEIEARGIKNAFQILGSAFDNPQEAAKFQLMKSYIEAQLKLATSNNTKVILLSSNPHDVLQKAVGFYESTH